MRVLSGLLIPVFATMRGSFNTGAAANLNSVVCWNERSSIGCCIETDEAERDSETRLP